MKTLTCLFVLLFCEVLCVPLISNENSFVISSPELPSGQRDKRDVEKDSKKIDIYEMDVKSNVSNRFATTLVTSKVKNLATTAQEATFSVVLPEKAFISEFVMIVGGKSYKAYVKEKKEAKEIYDNAVASGQGAAHVAVSARDSNRFTVSVNVEPASKATFLLTYEELLQRQNGFYELVLNIHPGQIVNQLTTEVHINESRPLTFVRTPSLRSGNEINKENEKLKPSTDINIVNSTSAVVKFNPSAEDQQRFATTMGDKEGNGLSGQFVVQYDVERDPRGGEVLLRDGYFVHFFAPSDLVVLPKQVIFVLDTSGSMGGGKIEQLKNAMESILTQLVGDNLLNIVQFSNDVVLWNNENQSYSTAIEHSYSKEENYGHLFPTLSEKELPPPVLASKENIDKAKVIINSIDANGGTNIIGGIETALYLGNQAEKLHGGKYQPIIIFLTDGDPNIGISSTDEIVKTVTRINNENHKIPIFSLSFGDGADRKFLRKLSLENQGFSRHIYEAADASLQLQEFFKHISSPLLSNVNFKYDSEVKEVTKTVFPIHFRGSELVVTGRYDVDFENKFGCVIDSKGPGGRIILKPIIEIPVTPLERLWAYLTIKQLLQEKELDKNNTEIEKKALDLALKYSFVTDVSSLVVVKPNETSAVDTENAAAGGGGYSSRGYIASGQRFAASYPIPQNAAVDFRLDAEPISSGDSGGPLVFHSTSFRPRPQPTIISTSTNSPKNLITSLKLALPWLANLNQNGSIILPQGPFELGDENTLVVDNAACLISPQNSTGVCTLLKDCPGVYSAIVDFQVYATQYFCPLYQKYAGVCCPKNEKIVFKNK